MNKGIFMIVVGGVFLVVLLIGGSAFGIHTGSSPEVSAPSVVTATTSTSPVIVLHSGVRGVVTIGPTCPVQRINDTSCDDKPYQTTLKITTPGKVLVKTITIDAQGRFEVVLPPGNYVIAPVQSQRIPYASEQSFTVSSGRFTNIQISFDSGIR